MEHTTATPASNDIDQSVSHSIDESVSSPNKHTTISTFSMNAPTVTSMRPRPIPNSYWATPLLLACEYPWTPSSSTQKLDLLLKAGVRTFIDLTETGELSPYAPHLAAHVAVLAAGDGTSAPALSMSDVAYHSFPIHDRSLPASP
ncbi:hypothetical protein EVG20_g11595, partial [Dentipellis fragilis]